MYLSTARGCARMYAAVSRTLFASKSPNPPKTCQPPSKANCELSADDIAAIANFFHFKLHPFAPTTELPKSPVLLLFFRIAFPSA